MSKPFRIHWYVNVGAGSVTEPTGMLAVSVLVDGVSVTIGALWLPWYEIRLDALFSSPQVSGQVSQLPEGLRQLTGELRALLPGSISGSGWQVMERSDVMLAVAGATVVILFMTVATLGADGRSVAQIMVAVGLIGLALVLYRFLKPPLPGAYCTVRQGLWVAAIGWVACIAGGLMQALQPQIATITLDLPKEPIEGALREAPDSVAPPTAKLF